MTSTDTNKEYIYAILDEHDGVKLGRTNNIARRLIELQTGNKDRLSILYCKQVKDSIKAENSLHAVFREWHINDEWFAFTDKVEELLFMIFAKKDLPKHRITQMRILGFIE